ncbi:3-dehydroquinate dehydratase [Kandleria vitulina]|uniref:3-dehydroquinate dehydratase n=1 Tax=Kandleria vitulina TaxID=1630 RepID=A0A1H2QAM9_9FIRM|nr:type I 3-dehydroquinate dehydratase [Kandleria vitulina]SDW03868.1 3-dehydroquinate dehydratase [Kandleria vitulina]HBG68090.1 type I 3-dehydroquinate dehydratase [Kandleria vitulina]
MPVIDKKLKVKNIVFGEGIPKICIPVTEKTAKDILETVKSYETHDGWDVLEVRLDYFEYYEDIDEVISLLKDIRQVTSRLVLATIRTIEEGGRVAVGPDTYFNHLKAMCESGCIDLVDIELTKGNSCVTQCVYAAHANDVVAIISKHDFNETPDNYTMKKYLRKMDDLGGDILKLAVMPQNKADVIRVLEVTDEVNNDVEPLLITISMGYLGSITRVSGESYGSVMTFATIGKKSAPGQIPLDQMIKTLYTLHND